LLNRPSVVEGFKGELSSDGNTFTLSWNEVENNADSSDLADLAGYNIYRAESIDTLGSDSPVGSVSSNTVTWSDIQINSHVYYYVVRAVDKSGIESVNSAVTDSSSAENLIVLSQDQQALVVLPGKINEVLYSESNSYGTDLKINIQRRTEQETGMVVRSWEFKVLKCSDGSEIKDFKFAAPLIDIQLSYEDSSSLAGSFSRAVYTSASQDDAQLGVFWHNGVEYVKLGGYVDSQLKALNVKAVQRATEFELSQIWPSKVFTPNDDGINDEINFVFENPKASIYTGEIYDITGALINDMESGDISDYSLKWDGATREGKTANKGVYIYQIKAEGKIINGTIILAK
jgi:gliding motility-associated-like protein